MMKGKRVKIVAAGMIGAMLLGGCGTAPYSLTEKEEAIIVNYAAHVVSKFNAYQGDGLTYLVEEETEETELAEEDVSVEETEIPEDTSEAGGQPGEQTQEEVGAADLDQVFGLEGLHIAYTGTEIRDSYIESDAYALDVSAGKTYLILKFNLVNASDEEIHLDNLSKRPTFRVSFQTAEEESIQATAYTTILLNDFSTYEENIPAQTTNEAVLLFEVPDSVTSAEQIVLKVNVNATTYEINL